MMQWLPYGGTAAEFQDHIRTFAAVFPAGDAGQGRRRLRHLHARIGGSPIAFDEANIREVLARPGVLEDISSAYDSPATTVDEWVGVIERQTWMTDAVARATAGSGPLITDDRPRPEYFLLAEAYRRCVELRTVDAARSPTRSIASASGLYAGRQPARDCAAPIDFNEIAGRSMRNQLADGDDST